MTESELPTDVDPLIAQRVVAIRDRFGIRGLRAAQALIEMEIAIFDHPADAPDNNSDN
jgi:hypothetical protein